MADSKAGNPKQQSLEELKYIQEVYQNQYAVASNSINLALQELQELNSAQKTLENSAIIEGREVIMGIGSDFYAFSKIPDAKRFIVAVGANYLVEKETDSAKQYVAEKIKRGNESLNKLMKSRKELESALLDISYKINSLL